jgi:hypothetical protein
MVFTANRTSEPLLGDFRCEAVLNLGTGKAFGRVHQLQQQQIHPPTTRLPDAMNHCKFCLFCPRLSRQLAKVALPKSLRHQRVPGENDDRLHLNSFLLAWAILCIWNGTTKKVSYLSKPKTRFTIIVVKSYTRLNSAISQRSSSLRMLDLKFKWP